MRLAVIVILGIALWGGCRPRLAAAAPGYVDNRVTAIPAARLLGEPGRALVDPRRQRVGDRLYGAARPLFFLFVFSQIVAFFWLWSSGNAARLRDALRRAIPNVFACRFAYGAALAIVAALAQFPANFIRFRVDYAFGTTAQHVLGWLRDILETAVIDGLVVGVIVACVFALVDRTRLWYLYAMAGLFVVTLSMAFLEPVIVAPLYNHFTPMPVSSGVSVPLEALAERAGVGEAPIYVADYSRRTSAAIADIAGFGPTKRIVLSDALLEDATTGEVLFLAAREFGHYAHHDDFRLSLFWTFLFIVCTALAVVTADRVAFRRDDDPLARLALVFALLGLFGAIVTPIYDSYSRNLESQADSYALALTHDRASAVRAFVRIADETLAPLCPSRAERVYFLNSPPLGTRIAKAGRRPDPCR
jgi:Zn-dependent protease with chaperone function